MPTATANTYPRWALAIFCGVTKADGRPVGVWRWGQLDQSQYTDCENATIKGDPNAQPLAIWCEKYSLFITAPAAIEVSWGNKDPLRVLRDLSYAFSEAQLRYAKAGSPPSVMNISCANGLLIRSLRNHGSVSSDTASAWVESYKADWDEQRMSWLRQGFDTGNCGTSGGK